ncbi:MAG: sigma 54-interacting transcriptional regulator [Deltaproteobacteria bacterium]|nr:sigma 54-interacting transcriptional regulator [Deltaproteobacteria bacterium]
MGFGLTDVVSLEALRELFESFTDLTGMVTALLDVEGNVLISTGWQDLCTRYHRVHPETLKRCRKSDTVLAAELHDGEGYHLYRCRNGLLDVAVPVVVSGRHIGNLFTGQFFFEPPDVEFFRRQAVEFGFDEASYLEALSRVPMLSEDRVRKTMTFLSRAATLIGEMGLTRLELLKANRDLKRNLVAVKSELGRAARFTFDDIVGVSSSIRDTLAKAKMFADSPSTVLLLGESGVGKEIFAQAIHNGSRRAGGPFIAVNCAGIPRELIQSELFGYEAGAFTGALKTGRAGKLEAADGGTLFLDEIGDMPLEMQTNLLRVLEERAVVRVGGTRVIPVDVRLIAATHRDLQEEREKGNFRKDLYFRLSVISLTIPPLRERLQDLPLLVERHVALVCRKLGKAVPRVNEAVPRLLSAHSWPGNVRELVNVLEQAVNLAIGGEILPSHLPAHFLVKTARGPVPPAARGTIEAPVALTAMEKQAIEQALERYRGNATKVAQVLGISRTTLYRKIRQCGINR